MTPEQYVQKLTEVSIKKQGSLSEILKLTKQQASAIAEAEAEEIEGLIQSKQVLIDKISEMDTEFEVYYSRLKTILNIQSLEDIKENQIRGAAELKHVVTVIVATIKQIQSLEIENKNKAEEVVNNLARDIRRVKQSKIANNGYNVASKLPSPSYFIDKKK
jgi:Zn-dependent oligopeptidase